MRRLGLCLLLAVPAWAYVVGPATYSWQTGAVVEPYLFRDQGWPASGGSGADYEARYVSAIERWNLEGDADVQLRYGGTTSQASWTPADGSNVAQYPDLPVSGATLAVAQLWATGINFSDTVECDVRFFSSNDLGPIVWSADPAGALPGEIDFELTATHELGHCLGLDHSGVSGAVMQASQTDGTGVAERALQPDDVAGLQAIYGLAPMPVPELVVDAVQLSEVFGDGDGQLEPGELFELVVGLRNQGQATASAVSGVLSSPSTDLSVVVDTLSWPDVAVGVSESSVGAFQLQVAPDCAADASVSLALLVQDSVGLSPLSLSVDLVCSPVLPPTDADGDGYSVDTDCDDTNPDVHPGAVERCDGADDDCNGLVDDDAVDTIPWFWDADGDDFGALAPSVQACDQPAGYAASDQDCDDTNRFISPAISERCNGVDDDCDGTVDEADAIDALTWYNDRDGDGVGAGVGLVACTAPSGSVRSNTDCDDLQAAAYPGAVEVCDGLDNDCNGVVDEADPAGVEVWYADIDGDGFGNPSLGLARCDQPPGTVVNDQDCDDTDDEVHPGATEICDGGVDNDCDGVADGADAQGAIPFYWDNDQDGFGNTRQQVLSCEAPLGSWSTDASDCDDDNPAVTPEAEEIWYNGRDENCDGVDDDQDGDGAPLGVDCDDLDPTVITCPLAEKPLVYRGGSCDAVGAAPSGWLWWWAPLLLGWRRRGAGR